ncbi:DUF1611 domain-containing protein [Halopenitus persicus]|uniref:Uncharacterized conserved protein, NAD-dependent epimerase/dehydratase family n=1 Tax=Halopenitus persicus TaxID=1048396 RepID=A0A1H3EHV5_9EURY|nr:DUF1611 domain-containing protein [Halopenitus persicus]QHS17572.1 DUF1611 domain-containing protein [haloarchaeon 3A1-DGR]SDX78326.1 Uncharacterized conserved protein, NAD-dependent epimerase/dehydratase family [Halopenitus persicus]
MDDQRIAILAHEMFPDRAKTALGVMRYGDQEVAAVLDRETAGTRVHDHLVESDAATIDDAPIAATFDDALELAGGPGDDGIDALLIGIAPIGGGLDDSWRADIRAAIEAGCDVIAGLHSFLNEDEEFATLAAEHGVDLVDVRDPHEGLGVAEGRAGEVDADVVCTVGTDCSVGKMTATMEIVAAARDRGIDAAVIPTGQTGILIEGWGNPIDRVISDFTAGAVEEMILEKGDEHDLLVVEGQGSIVHPAYSAVTCGILHGSMPDALVLCHAAGREAVHGYESFELPAIPEYVDLYESLSAPVADADVVAGALNTKDVADDETARAAVADLEDGIRAPATDPVRFGAEAIVDAIESEVLEG